MYQLFAEMIGKQWSSFKVTDCWNSQPADSTDYAVYFMRAMKVLVTEHFMQFIAAITHSNTDKYICYFNHYSVKIGMILRKPERKNRTVIAAFWQRCKIGYKLDEPKLNSWREIKPYFNSVETSRTAIIPPSLDLKVLITEDSHKNFEERLLYWIYSFRLARLTDSEACRQATLGWNRRGVAMYLYSQGPAQVFQELQ